MNSSPYHPLGSAHFISGLVQSEKVAAMRIGVFFATREGHTQAVAYRIAPSLRKQGFAADLHNVKDPLLYSLSSYSGVILAASVHGGEHEKEMVKFVKDHRSELERMKTAFLSVSLSEAGAEKIEATPAEHVRYVSDVNSMLDKFFKETRWRPSLVKPVAGALLYTRYNFLLRLIMRSIARKEGAATDTSRDYVYTDWAGLDNFIDEFVGEIHSAAGQAVHTK